MMVSRARFRKRFIAALVGTGLVALCCFTPLLVIGLGLAGLSFVTPYLDFLLLPSLVILILVTIRAYRQWRAAERDTA